MSIIFPYPALHLETLDFKNPKGYSSKVHRANTKITIDHCLGSDSLVQELVRQEVAMFCSTVSVRGSIHKRTELALEKIEHVQDRVLCRQVVEIPEFKNELQIFINCGVATIFEIKGNQVDCGNIEFSISNNNQIKDFMIAKEKTGLSEFFLDSNIHFPDRALIAYSGWKRFFSQDSLFTIESNPELGNDRVFSTEISYLPQLKIHIEMPPDLYNEIKNSKDSPARAHVICASLVKALAELQDAHEKVKEQGDDADSSLIQLLEQAEGLKGFLETSDPPIPSWESENFNAVHSASAYKPVLHPAEKMSE